MNKPKGQTVGFTLSAAVPVESVGFVLKAMFDAGCPPNSLDLKAIIGGAINGHAIIDAPAAPRLGKPNKGQKYPSNYKAEHLREAVLAVMAAHAGAIQRKDLFAAVCEKLGENIVLARLNAVANAFVTDGQIKSNGHGLYTLTKIGRRDAGITPTETGA